MSINREIDKEDGPMDLDTVILSEVSQTHEKMLDIAHYERNAKQNYNEISLHTSQNGHHQKVYKQ